jgi:tRNA A-37 threonylcarbamoyl transferase component Bud32
MLAQAGRFGKYEIVRKLSRSMTDVYLAKEAAGKQIVLKLIEESRDEYTKTVIEAEKRGAQLQRQLHSLDPRILEVYDFGEQDGCFFVALEYFEGLTLTEILAKEQRLEPRRAARYGAEICSQLRTLHSFVSDVNGRMTAVVHGDVKPSNIQIGLQDELKLLDFGIAKMITATHNLTRHNLGSPSYCSPERLSSSQVDVHSDLWALGVTLFETLSGSPPYQAQDTRRLENLIQSRRPPRALPDDIPLPLRAIIAKALAGDINHRYHTAAEFEKDLRAFLEERQPAAAGQKSSWEANATLKKIEPAPVRAPSNPTKLTAKPMPPAPPAPVQVALKARPRKGRFESSNMAIAALAGILAGLLILLPVVCFYRIEKATEPLRSKRDYAHDNSAEIVNADWALYQSLKGKNSLLGPFSPVVWAETSFRYDLVEAGDNILDAYRTSSDTKLSDFDWSRARLCLRHALEIDPSDTKVKGKLAIVEGYSNMVQYPRPPRASLSIDSFRQAASYLPKSPDPHLGLARLYVYAFRNIGEALPEFQQAERLGYQLGPREQTEEADGYLYRSEWELVQARKAISDDHEERDKWLEMYQVDADRARKLYEPLVGYSNVSANLQQIYQDKAEQARILNGEPQLPRRRPGFRRWQ